MDGKLTVVRVPGHMEDIHVSEVTPVKDSLFALSAILGIGGFFVMMVCFFIGSIMVEQKNTGASIIGGILMGGGMILPLLGIAFMMVVFTAIFYKGWKVIQVARFLRPDETIDMPTPGVATALNFVFPFSLYWSFVVCRDLEKYGRIVSEAKGVPYVGPSKGLCVAVPLLLVLFICFSYIPGINLALLITYMVMLHQINKMVKQLGDPYTIRTMI